ncbi:GGDEF domain-containing response regulator [Rossellomorea arthrocnemi]|jgi:two-component system, cell cycle response regulator|uniref:GGDEF domain-containing response regulator n=1 Tax=Rossellomorea arthrocnemi TaxID=2769542 RepID=UPI00191A064C|nr:diguanylate cyclase [Rossellomorea arthrocnemi]
MEKYTKHFFNNIRKKLEEWEAAASIPHEEVYRFIHSMAGSASVLGLHKIGNRARELMDKHKEKDERTWTISEVKEELFDIIQYCYHYYEEESSELFPGKQSRDGEEPVVLLIDDDTSFLMYMKEELEKIGWYVVPIANPDKAVMSYYDVKPDCAIIDIYMDGTNGFEVLDFFKKKLKQQFIPTIMVSVENSKKVRMKSYQMGADDFIAKPFELDEFIVRVKRQMERKKQMEELVLIDELTRVYNRKYLSQAYAQVQSDWTRRGDSYCVAVLDLDHFKGVNDRYGHLMGDRVLKEFASHLKSETRIQDTVFRFGGEEFIILFPHTSIKEACTLVDDIRKRFSQLVFQADPDFSCTFSAGVAEIADPTKPFNTWLTLADHALYEAKSSGRNLVKLDGKAREHTPHKMLKIAIVDDDPIIRTVMRDIVSKLPSEQHTQYDIHTFKDGAAFIGSDWHEENPCLVILDGVMPKMDGLEVLEQLRSRSDSDRYKVLMLTSRKSERDISRSLQLGADDYMTKPFKLLELEARLGQMLKRMR